MSVSMSPGITGVHLPLSSIGTMVSRREKSKTPFKAHGDVVDQVSMSLPTHKDIKLFIDKDIKI